MERDILKRPQDISQRSRHLEVVIKAAHKRTRKTFGPGRLQQDIVKSEGVQVGVHRIKRLCIELVFRHSNETRE